MLTSTSEIYSHKRSANALCKAKRVEICDETDKKKEKVSRGNYVSKDFNRV